MSLRDTNPYLKGKLADLYTELNALTSTRIERGLTPKQAARLREIEKRIKEATNGKDSD